MLLTLTSLLAFSSSIPLASAWRNPFYEYKSYPLAKRATDKTAFVFLCNCWATPGARSEVDYFSSYPNDFGSATPEFSTIISDSSNYVFEDGGSADDPNGGTFTWTITNKNASTNAKAGTATDGSNQYILLRDTDSTLYKPTQDGSSYNCIVVYRAQLSNAASTTTLPPSSNSTTTTTGGSTTTPANSPAQTTGDMTQSSEAEADTGLSTGAKAGIGIGVALGVLIIGGVIAFFVWRSRRARKDTSGPMGVYPDEKKGAIPYPTGVNAVPMHGGHTASELHNEPVAELGDMDHRVVEAPGNYERVPQSPLELDSGVYHHQSPA